MGRSMGVACRLGGGNRRRTSRPGESCTSVCVAREWRAGGLISMDREYAAGRSPQERAACWRREGMSSAVSRSPECSVPAGRRNGRPSSSARPRISLVSTKGALARRGRRRAACDIRAAHPAHCTASHGTVRTHPLQVCPAPAHEAPMGFAHGRHRPWVATVSAGVDSRDIDRAASRRGESRGAGPRSAGPAAWCRRERRGGDRPRPCVSFWCRVVLVGRGRIRN